MNRKFSISRTTHRIGAFLVHTIALGLALNAGPVRADELGAFPDPEPAEKLERAFWDCERAAVAGMSLDDGLVCAEITEELKRTLFGSDFDALLAYWQAHKAEQVGEPEQRLEVAGADMVP